MKNLVRLIIFGALLCPIISLIISCSEDEDCTDATRPMMQCNLYTINTSTNTISRDTLDSLTITAFSTDSIIINNEEDVCALSLPLRYAADSTGLIFHYSGTKNDTIIVYHTNTPYFLSMDCGYQMKQVITSVSYSRYALDSISITDNEAGINGTENLKLFY